MTNRTVKVQGWGEGTAKLTAELNGQVIFSGNVDLEPFSDENADKVHAPSLFTFEIPMDTQGSIPMKINVSSAPVRFGMIIANYTVVDHAELYNTGAYAFEDIAPLTPDGVRDPRANVKIDGILQTIERQGRAGTWHWHVYPGSTLEYDLQVKAGREN